jgi:hypothetical protein
MHDFELSINLLELQVLDFFLNYRFRVTFVAAWISDVETVKKLVT